MTYNEVFLSETDLFYIERRIGEGSGKNCNKDIMSCAQCPMARIFIKPVPRGGCYDKAIVFKKIYALSVIKELLT